MKDIIICGFSIEWDDQKNRANKSKHGISFLTAAYVFADEFRLEFLDDAHSDDETRYVTIGLVADVLYVVYTERGDAARLISARRATNFEKEQYYEYNKNRYPTRG